MPIKIEKTKGFKDWHENYWILYGIPKVGKTTFASKFSDALFLLTEDGAEFVSVNFIRIKRWTDFAEAISFIKDEIKKGTFEYKTIVIDTVDNLADFGMEFIAGKYGKNDIGNFEYGRGFGYFTREFKKQINALTGLGVGIGFISHAKEVEMKVNPDLNPYSPFMADMESGTFTAIAPSADKRARDFILGLCDVIMYAELNKNNQRVIYTKPTKFFMAGDRSNRLPEVLPTAPASDNTDMDRLLIYYYGEHHDNNNPNADEAKDYILERIKAGEAYLAQYMIDGFDVPTRLSNSRKKHAGTDKLEDAPMSKLENYLHHLKIKAKANNKKENKNG